MFKKPWRWRLGSNYNAKWEIKRISGSEKDTTNNRMELIAPINALKEMKSNEQIEIYTDSQYVKLGITEWINKWVKIIGKLQKKKM